MQGGIRPGYKQTEVGVIPEDWDAPNLGSLRTLMTNGFVGTATRHYSREGTGVLYVQGYNVEENSFNFNGIKYVTEEFHKQHLKSCLKAGDLLTVQTGDVGLTTVVPEALAGANCHALIITRFDHRRVYPSFVSYYLNGDEGRARLRLIETGTTMKHLNIGDMLHFVLPLPPLHEQRAIAAALADADGLIAALEGMIAKKRDLKQAAMQHLLTGKARRPGFSGEWEVKRLGDLLEYEQPTKYLVSSTDYDDSYDIPVLTAGKSFLLGHTNESHGVFAQLPVIIFDDFTTATQFVDFPFKAKSSAMKLLKPRNPQVNLRLVYDMMQTIKFVMSDHKRYWISEYQKIEVPFPDPAEQTAIAEVLSDMDADLAALEAQAAKARAVKQGMMQELLTGRVRLV